VWKHLECNDVLENALPSKMGCVGHNERGANRRMIVRNMQGLSVDTRTRPSRSGERDILLKGAFDFGL